MGNHLCCVKPSRTTAAAKVIRWNDGGIENFGEAIKVGELMVDNPQQFVCDFSDLQAGRRIAALRPEQDLALGGVYVLLPMQKYLRCVLSPSDMASLNLLAFRCNSTHGKNSCNSRVFPAVGTRHLSEFSSKNGSAERPAQLQTKLTDRCVVPKLELNEDEDQTTELGLGLGLSQQRIRGLRYWKPVLETIKESPRVLKP
jgi:hypothetical protein